MGVPRRWLAAALACMSLSLLCALAVLVLLDAPAPSAHAAPTGYAASSRYGADATRMQNAVTAAAWPQQSSNWCGIATVSAIANYQGHAASQSTVANYLNSSSSRSEWGTAPHTSTVAGPGFVADIAGDFGTDPRSLAAGLAAEAGGGYHQLIDLVGASDATNHLVADVARSQQPISVIVDHGLHSVLVAAVYATADPTSDPSSVTALEVWDPGYGAGDEIQGAQVEQVSISTWLSSSIYWGSSYSANYQGSVADDPDPSVGAYTYDPSQSENGHLWIGHRVYLRPDESGDSSSGVNPDWAFAQSGALITGQHGETPTGYSGATTPIQPPPPAPTATPKPATPVPTKTPVPTRVPTRVPTAAPTKVPTAIPTATLIASTTSVPTMVAQPTATALPLPIATPQPTHTDPASIPIPILALAGVIGAVIVLSLLVEALVRLRSRRRRTPGEEREPALVDVLPAPPTTVPPHQTDGPDPV